MTTQRRGSTSWEDIYSGAGDDGAGVRDSADLYELLRGGPPPYRGGVRDSAVTVSTTPVELPAPSERTATRRLVLVYNNSGNTVYLGGPTVSTGSGLPLEPSASFQLTIGDAPLYAVGTTTTILRVMEVS